MLKLVSGQHTKNPGGGLSGPPGMSAHPSTDTQLIMLPLDLGQAGVPAKSPAAAAVGPQQFLQQHQRSSKPGPGASPQKLLAMVHLLDSQLSQLEQRLDGQQPADGAQNMQAPRQRDHSLEAPAVICRAPPLDLGPHVFNGTPAAEGSHAAARLPIDQSRLQQEPQSQYLQQQHTVEAPSLLSGPGQLPPNSLSAGGLRGPAHQRLTDLLLGPKAADQAPQHGRGLLAAGAYVLQPAKPGAGDQKRRSSSPEEQPWLQHVDTAAGPVLPPAVPAGPRQPQQQQHQAPPDGGYQQAVVAQAGAAEAAAAAAGSGTVRESGPDQLMLLMQQRQMLQQQQQQLWRLQQERQMLQQQQQHRLPPPEMQRQMPPRQVQQQRYQQPHQRQQYSQQSAQDMEVDADVQDAAGALDMLSEIAAAAAAAEEMYAGVPSPLRPDLLIAQALAAAPGAFRPKPVVSQPVARQVLTGRQQSKPAGHAGAGAAQAATNIPAAAAAAIAAAEHSTGSRNAQAKRSRGSSNSAASDAVAQAFAEAPPSVTKRTRMGDRHAADVAAAQSAAAAMHAAAMQQQQERLSSSAGKAAGVSLGGGRAGGVLALGARLGFNAGPADGTFLAAGSGMPAETILAAVAELAALAAAAGQPASQSGSLSAAPPAQGQQRRLLPQAMQAAPAAQAPGRAGLPVAHLLRSPAPAGGTAYQMHPPAQFVQQGLAQQHSSNSAALLAAMQAAGSARGNSSAGAAGRGLTRQSAQAAHRQAATQPAGVYAEDRADEAAHDLAMFAAAAAAVAAAGTYHRSPAAAAAAAPPAAASHETHTEGRRQRKSAAAAAAFIAAALAPADDSMPYAAAADNDDYDNSSEEQRQNKARPHKRHPHPERQQSPAAMNLDLLAAAASSPDLGAAADEEASAGLPAAAAAAGGRQRGRGYNAGRGRLGSGGSGDVLHGQEETSDAADGGAYVCEEEEGDGQDSDGEEHQSHSSKNQANNERVLSNRLAASRSYQRRKEEMLRLEQTHARLQMEHQAVRHALQEINREMQVHADIAAAFVSSHDAVPVDPPAADPEHAAAAFLAGHAAMHGVLAQRLQGVYEDQQRQRRLHADRVEEAALAAAAAAEGFNTDGSSGSGSGSVSYCDSQ